ncbi:beta-CASP ribonuclease aCPSF1 [Candidatus Micrarchaeota archaeon]|nr:beta-CASP ribonuclease aCPSF1 [Candidatus Micrarchaeota archaeon]
MDLKEIEAKIKEIVPKECGLTMIEPEGLAIVIYVTDINKVYENTNLIRQIAGAIKKRIVIRVDSSRLMEPDKALPIIKKLIPEDAGVDSIKFNPEFNEVWIVAFKPGLVIGKKGAVIKQIITKTGWSTRIFRLPTMDSATIKGIRNTLLKESPKRKKFMVKMGKRINKNIKRSEWVKVTALGGFREVGRSCLLVETTNNKILIDCGINPDTSDSAKLYPYLDTLNIELSDIDAVILSHAHLDHCGFIPYLYAYGYKGPVFATKPTRDLAVLLQMDYLQIMNRYVDKEPPYNIKHIHKELSNTITVDYNEVVDITPEIKLTFYNAGHILGSTMAHLHIDDGLHNLVYTGDFKYGFSRMLDPANTQFPRVETLFMESTYGGKSDVVPKRRDAEEKLIQIIGETLANKGKVLIPAFAVGRSQEVMLVLEEYKRRGQFDSTIYLDGMIREASAIHTAYPEFLRAAVQKRILANDSPFESEIFETVKGDRKAIVEGDPCVILAPSGMLSGGPSLEYLRLMAEDPKNTLIFVGYQGAFTLGRKLQGGAKQIPLMNEDGKTDTVNINLRVETVEGFSGHSDRKQLLAYARNVTPRPERIFIMHGDPSKEEDLAGTLNHMFHINTSCPMDLDSIRLK